MLLRKRASIVVFLSPPEPLYVSAAVRSARQARHGVYRMRRPPDGMGKFVGLKSKRCAPCEGGNVPKLSQAEAEALRIQVNRCPAVVQQTRLEAAFAVVRFARAACQVYHAVLTGQLAVDHHGGRAECNPARVQGALPVLPC